MTALDIIIGARSVELSLGARAVLAELAVRLHGDEREADTATVYGWLDDIGVSEHKAKRHLAELRRNGLIEVKLVLRSATYRVVSTGGTSATAAVPSVAPVPPVDRPSVAPVPPLPPTELRSKIREKTMDRSVNVHGVKPSTVDPLAVARLLRLEQEHNPEDILHERTSRKLLERFLSLRVDPWSEEDLAAWMDQCARIGVRTVTWSFILGPTEWIVERRTAWRASADTGPQYTDLTAYARRAAK